MNTAAQSPRMFVTPDAFIFLCLAALALALRLWSLSADSFGADESRLALQALDLLTGGSVSLESPGSVTLTGLSFLLFGDSDASARLPAALASSATVAGIWFLGPWIGRYGALLTALLLATSPTLSYLSPRLGGAAVAVLTLLFMAWGTARLASDGSSDRVFLWQMAISLPLLLTLGPIGIAGILVLAIYLVLDYVLFGKSGVLGELELVAAEKRSAVLVASLWAVSLLLLPAIGGPGHTKFPGMASFVDMFKLPLTGYSPLLPWVRLMAYDVVLLIMGVAGTAFVATSNHIGIMRLRDSRSVFQRFVVVWAVVGTFALLLSGPAHQGLLIFLLTPLGINAGILLQKASEGLDFSKWRRALFSVGLFVALSFWLFLTVAGTTPTSLESWGIAPVLLAGFSFFLIAAALMLLKRRVRLDAGGLVAGFLTLGLFLNLHNMSFLVSGDTSGELLGQPGVRSDSLTIIRNSTGAGQGVVSDKSLKVTVEPALEYPFRWYLRDVSALKFSTSDGTEDILLSGTDAARLAPGHRRMELPYSSGWRYGDLDIRKSTRWLLYREIPAGEQEVSKIYYWTRIR